MSGSSNLPSGRSVMLDKDTALALERVVKVTGKSPQAITRAAVREFVEDYFDMLEIRRRRDSKAKSVPWPVVKKRLGLEG